MPYLKCMILLDSASNSYLPKVNRLPPSPPLVCRHFSIPCVPTSSWTHTFLGSATDSQSGVPSWQHQKPLEISPKFRFLTPGFLCTLAELETRGWTQICISANFPGDSCPYCPLIILDSAAGIRTQDFLHARGTLSHCTHQAPCCSIRTWGPTCKQIGFCFGWGRVQGNIWDRILVYVAKAGLKVFILIPQLASITSVCPIVMALDKVLIIYWVVDLI